MDDDDLTELLSRLSDLEGEVSEMAARLTDLEDVATPRPRRPLRRKQERRNEDA